MTQILTTLAASMPPQDRPGRSVQGQGVRMRAMSRPDPGQEPGLWEPGLWEHDCNRALPPPPAEGMASFRPGPAPHAAAPVVAAGSCETGTE